jgi:hypothetical protein
MYKLISNDYDPLYIWEMAEPFDALRIEESEFIIKVFFYLPDRHWGSKTCDNFCRTLKGFDYFVQTETNDQNRELAVVFRKFRL